MLTKIAALLQGKLGVAIQSKAALAVLGAVLVGGTGTAAVAVTVTHTSVSLPIVGQVGGSSSNGQNGNSGKGQANGNASGSTHAHTIGLEGSLQGVTGCPTTDPTQVTQISVLVKSADVENVQTTDNTSTSTSTSTSDTSTVTSTSTPTDTPTDTSTSTSTSTDNTSTSTSADTSTSTSTSTSTDTTSTSAPTDTSTTSTSASTAPTTITSGQVVTITVSSTGTRVTGAQAKDLTSLCGAIGKGVQVSTTQGTDGSLTAWKVTVQGGDTNGQGNGQGKGNGQGNGNGNSNGQGNGGQGTGSTGGQAHTTVTGTVSQVSDGSFVLAPTSADAAVAPVTVTFTNSTKCGASSCHAFLQNGMTVTVVGTVTGSDTIQADTITAAGH